MLEWLIRIITYVVVMVVSFIVSLVVGAVAMLIAWLGRVYDLIGVNGTLWAICVPVLIVLGVAVWQGRKWRHNWLWRKWSIWTE